MVEELAEVIKNGGVVLYPTDTIWGLGCDPMNEAALEKINRIKNRQADKNYLLLINSERQLHYHVQKVPEVCYDLIDFATKPLTIIYPKGKHVAPTVLAPDGSLGIRMIKEPVYLNQLLTKLKHGLISTSANISGEPFPKHFNDIDERIKSQVDFIVDHSLENKNTQPSQIIKIGENSEVSIIRK
ncbi:MAG: L-threonylcarbamoyladenylate synthase [Putridiphycobacter sp.]|nr:L-threonylcarbamoyladenylate synthase [Putridiphycobacter sp.]